MEEELMEIAKRQKQIFKAEVCTRKILTFCETIFYIYINV